MRRIRLATGRRALFGAMMLVVLIALLPLRMVLGVAAVGATGLTARSVAGSVWAGRLRDARVAGVPLGDLNAHLSPWALLIGQARVELDSDVDTPTRMLHGAIGATRTGVRVDDMTATLAPGALFAPLPVTSVALDAVSIRFVDGRCESAGGRVRAMLAADVAGVALPAMVSGSIRCDGAALLIPLASQAGAERVDLRVEGNGRYGATLTLQPVDAATLVKLQGLGFVQDAGGYVLSIEGRF